MTTTPPIRSLDEEAELGRSARSQTPRSAVAEWRPAEDRFDPVAVLATQDESRVPGLVPERHARMSVSAFTFYRGAAAIMANDLATVPVSGLEVQLCGDAHLSNLGAFASPSRDLLFDLNDFDETLRGPWEWDVLRLATSFTIAGRDRGFPRATVADITRTVVASYRLSMADMANRSPLDVWYARLDTERIGEALRGESKKARKAFEEGVESARRRTSLQAARKLTEVGEDGRPRFRSDPPVLFPLGSITDAYDSEQLGSAIRATFTEYVETLPDSHAFLLGRYRVVDIAHKVVGVGSVGARAFIVLLQGPAGEPLILQFKEAVASVLESHLAPSHYQHHGERVVKGQRMMQAASDIFLGWSTSSLDGRHYYWRQLRDMKASAEIEEMSPKGLSSYAQMCGWSLARAHARSGSPAAIAAYLGKGDRYDEAAVSFARRYASLNEADYAAHQQAIADGVLPSQPIEEHLLPD